MHSRDQNVLVIRHEAIGRDTARRFSSSIRQHAGKDIDKSGFREYVFAIPYAQGNCYRNLTLIELAGKAMPFLPDGHLKVRDLPFVAAGFSLRCLPRCLRSLKPAPTKPDQIHIIRFS